MPQKLPSGPNPVGERWVRGDEDDAEDVRAAHREAGAARRQARPASGRGGLCFQIARNGSRSWIFRFRIGGRRRYLGLGTARDVTLAEARQRAATARAMLDAGQDPIDARNGRRAAAMLNAAKVLSFREAATAFIEAHSVASKSIGQWTASLDTYVNPVFGALPVQEIDTGLVMKVIEPLWTTKTVTAGRIRNRIERILNWAKARGYRDGENPARWSGHLENLLAKKSKVAKVTHHAALPYGEMPEFMAQLRDVGGNAARALEFLILTAARSGEVFHATWAEVDLGRSYVDRPRRAHEEQARPSCPAQRRGGGDPGSHAR